MIKNLKCERCRQTFIEEEFDEHLCTPITTKTQEIGIDYIFEGEIDQNGDKVHIAKGLNGIIYRLVVCPHNPTHTNTHPTTFDSEEIRHRFDSTQNNHIFNQLPRFCA